MSDGMSDATALGRHEAEVREAAHELAIALRQAVDGHRGWAISRGDLMRMVNEYLQDEGAYFALQVSVTR
jgi:hypothetical protein